MIRKRKLLFVLVDRWDINDEPFRKIVEECLKEDFGLRISDCIFDPVLEDCYDFQRGATLVFR